MCLYARFVLYEAKLMPKNKKTRSVNKVVNKKSATKRLIGRTNSFAIICYITILK